MLMRASLCFFLLALGSCADIRPLAGGQLKGTLRPAPTQWQSPDDVDIIQLETNPSEPYSVKLWVIELEGSLYVHAGANRAK